MAGGPGIFLDQTWWRSFVVGAAILSSALYVIFWDGTRRDLDDQGGVGLLINLALLAIVLVADWPGTGG